MLAQIAVSSIANLYGNRVRGGLYALPGGDLTARMIGMMPFGLMTLWLGWTWPWALALYGAALIGCFVAGSGGAYSMRNGAKDWALMAIYAFERLLLVVIVLLYHSGSHGGIMIAALPLCPLCYWLARFWPVNLRFLGIKAASGTNAGGEDSAFGEALFGAAYGALLILSMGVIHG